MLILNYFYRHPWATACVCGGESCASLTGCAESPSLSGAGTHVSHRIAIAHDKVLISCCAYLHLTNTAYDFHHPFSPGLSPFPPCPGTLFALSAISWELRCVKRVAMSDDECHSSLQSWREGSARCGAVGTRRTRPSVKPLRLCIETNHLSDPLYL